MVPKLWSREPKGSAKISQRIYGYISIFANLKFIHVIKFLIPDTYTRTHYIYMNKDVRSRGYLSKTKGVREKILREIFVDIYKNSYINLPLSEAGIILCRAHYNQVITRGCLHNIDKFHVPLIN